MRLLRYEAEAAFGYDLIFGFSQQASGDHRLDGGQDNRSQAAPEPGRH
jgi:hypothetical protein